MKTIQRFGSVIGVRAQAVSEYRRIHTSVWPSVLATIKRCHIQNYSIFLRRMPDGKHYLFSYYEYTGDDHAADMAKMAADPTTQEWWKLCMPMQEPLAERTAEEWWASGEEVFHLD